MIHKKLPGKDSMIYVCDHRDRLVLAQDGNLRNSNKWTFIKYDELDRPILSGIVTKYYSREALQDSLDLYIGSNLFEERSSNGTHEYTNRSFPDISSADVYAVNYYDDYDFDFNQDTLFDYHQLTSEYPVTPDYRVCGKATGGKVKMIGQEFWWQSNDDTISAYGFQYDDQYQLQNAYYHYKDGSWNDSERGDFCDGTNGYSGTEYEYDDNGNMISDDNKGISSISFDILPSLKRTGFTHLEDNLLNLPDHMADVQQENHFYPFGLKMTEKSYLSGLDNRYLYTGKSLDEQHGLDWYFHGARYYDPQLAR